MRDDAGLGTTDPGELRYLTDTGWIEKPTQLLPSVEGDIQCDVAVIGGGLCGMAASRKLALQGADVVLLEAGVAGWAASSRNAGFLTSIVATDPLAVSLLHRDRLQSLIRLAENAVGFTEDLMAELALNCEYERTGIFRGAVSTQQLRRARRVASALRDAGARVEFVEGRNVGVPDTFVGGLRERAGGGLNPGILAMGLRGAVLKAGVNLFETTPAMAITDRGDHVAVRVPGGRVRAQQILLATNAHSRQIAIAPRHLATPVWVTLVETAAIAPERIEATGWTSREPIATQHLLLENYRLSSRETILFGTRQVQSTQGRLDSRHCSPDVVADIVEGFRATFPTLKDVEFQRTWGGWIGMTSSSLPVAGAVTPRVFYAIGCNGHGLALAPYLGSLAADRLAGKPPHDDLRAVWHSRSWFAPNPVSALTLKAAWTFDRMSDRLGRVGPRQ